ncbi:RICIN domain-containing protein [Streptomyces sp. NPDC008137]|uniref:RICIN domain-containing protein n=1 Tax=Streptomyces sp. NPDC008137 TaxID=3364813 RepID=UPI0036EB2FB8
MANELIDNLRITVRTCDLPGAGTPGRVYLGAAGREFTLSTGGDDFAQGATTTIVLGGPDTDVSDRSGADPRDPHLYLADLLRCPVYVRFAALTPHDVWQVERVDLTVRTDTGRVFEYEVLADLPNDPQRLRLSDAHGEVVHLRPRFDHKQEQEHFQEGTLVTDVPFGKKQVIVHSASGLIITPRGHLTAAGTEMRLWQAGLPAVGPNHNAAGANLGRIWQFEKVDNGVRIRNHLDKPMYLSVTEGEENTTVKMSEKRSGDSGQVWRLEQALPGLSDFLLVPVLNTGLAVGPLEGAQILENVLVLRRRASLDLLWKAHTPSPAKADDV